MAQLIVSKLPDAIVRALRLRAARNGRSREAEHREILRRQLLGSGRRVPLIDLLLGMPQVGTDEDFERLPDHGREAPP